MTHDELKKKLVRKLNQYAIPNIHGDKFPKILDNVNVDYLAGELTKYLADRAKRYNRRKDKTPKRYLVCYQSKQNVDKAEKIEKILVYLGGHNINGFAFRDTNSFYWIDDAHIIRVGSKPKGYIIGDVEEDFIKFKLK